MLERKFILTSCTFSDVVIWSEHTEIDNLSVHIQGGGKALRAKGYVKLPRSVIEQLANGKVFGFAHRAISDWKFPDWTDEVVIDVLFPEILQFLFQFQAVLWRYHNKLKSDFRIIRSSENLAQLLYLVTSIDLASIYYCLLSWKP